MLEFKDKLRNIRRGNKLTQNDLASILKVSNGTIAMWETGKRQPDLEMITQISKYFKVSVDYLLGNQDHFSQLTPKIGVKIPVLGIIPAGIPIEAVEDILDYEEISEEMAKTGEFFALKVRGNSMTPTINDGDVVIIKKVDDAESGKICVIMINGFDATLKQIKKEQNGIWVIPHNPTCDFKPTFYTNSEIESLPIKIIGVAIEIRRTL